MEDEAKQQQLFGEEEEGEIPVNDELELDDDLYKSFSHGTREFHILDELDATAVEEGSEEGNKENGESDYSSNQDSDGEFDLEEDEIDAMLDECKNYKICFMVYLCLIIFVFRSSRGIQNKKKV